MADKLRLLNVRTLRLETGFKHTPPYVILSHRWRDGEVNFQQMQDEAERDEQDGFAKIKSFCSQAESDGFHYVWIDTCCINKQSDAELSEAINSMFRWYQAAQRCYLYLHDVDRDPTLTITEAERTRRCKPFGTTSELFERGWTLQELLAPRTVVIHDRDWNLLGTKGTLAPTLAKITGVDEEVLRGYPILKRSLAQRMAWAASRDTVRVEDRAYSLLGIFGIYMPVVYGEGWNAFARLQREIISQSDDHSIFAWSMGNETRPGLLADSPDDFISSAHIVPFTAQESRSPYSMTNRGLTIKLMAIPWTLDTYLVRLDCVDEREQGCIGVYLHRLDEDDQYARVHYGADSFTHLPSSFWFSRYREFHVKQSNAFTDSQELMPRINGFRIATRSLFLHNESGEKLYSVECAGMVDKYSGLITVAPPLGHTLGTVATINIDKQHKALKVIKLGFDFDFKPVCILAKDDGLEEKGKSRLDRHGRHHFNAPGKLAAQYTVEERSQWPNIHQRYPYDHFAWSSIWNRHVEHFPQHMGLWALKGDRQKGLDVSIRDVVDVAIARGECNGKLVWEVHFNNLESEPEQGW